MKKDVWSLFLLCTELCRLSTLLHSKAIVKCYHTTVKMFYALSTDIKAYKRERQRKVRPRQLSV